MLKIYGSRKPKGRILRSLRKVGINRKVTIHIGKSGLTEGVIKEIKEQIKKNKVVKIRILKNAYFYSEKDRRKYIENLCKELIGNGIMVVDVRGNTLLVSRFQE